MQYRSKYFKIHELVNPSLLSKLGEALCWTLFDPNLLKLADKIREKYGACTVNGNGLIDCGLRDFNSDTGAKYSAHKIGKALDIHIAEIERQNLSVETKVKAYNNVRLVLLSDLNFSALSFEQNVSWLHIDTMNRVQRIFYP